MGQLEELTEVPALVGMPPAQAHDAALDAQLLAVDQDPAHSPTVAGVVAAQKPEAGSKVSTGHRVMIWVRTGGPEGGGGGGGRGNLPLPDQPRPLSTVGCK
ncbi:MAG TPA: PASTA domain-containing protein [Pseudonocardia sp.]|jgi:beta-lactam-binding protein with PASTA domain|uniref:PASTA domain-containing protein n=1 Tax=Pseudonocardia sp. TaxID=60912 RepID=UPI002F413DE2